jgi:hypothetical protein
MCPVGYCSSISLSSQGLTFTLLNAAFGGPPAGDLTGQANSRNSSNYLRVREHGDKH